MTGVPVSPRCPRVSPGDTRPAGVPVSPSPYRGDTWTGDTQRPTEAPPVPLLLPSLAATTDQEHRMADLIPAQPGWYIRETDGEAVVMDPIIAWKAATDKDGDDILLPFVSGGAMEPAMLMDADSLKYWNRTIVYDPSPDVPVVKL